MEAGPNLEAIQTAKARTEEAQAATNKLAESLPGALEAITAIIDELKNDALAAASTVEQSYEASATALNATEDHLNATPGDHQAVMAIIAAKDSCETATTGMGNVNDSTGGIPGGLQELSDNLTTAIAAYMTGKIEENAGQINQVVAELGTAETNIESVKA